LQRRGAEVKLYTAVMLLRIYNIRFDLCTPSPPHPKAQRSQGQKIILLYSSLLVFRCIPWHSILF
jgi:hypothetical protein